MGEDQKSLTGVLSTLETELSQENLEDFLAVANPLLSTRPDLNLIARKAKIGLGMADQDTWIDLFENFCQQKKVFLAICCAQAIWLHYGNSGIHQRYLELAEQYNKKLEDELVTIKDWFSRNEIRKGISVIMATYNRGQQIRPAIESVLNQSYQDFELIVVNDGGTPQCQQVVDSFHSDKIRYLEVNHGGLSHALNQGILRSRSRYICYLDDDDQFYPEHLETVVSALETSGYPLVYTDGYRITLKKTEYAFEQVAKEIAYSVDFNPGMLSKWNYLPILCVGHRRDCFEKCGLFEVELANMMDWDLWVRFSRLFDFYHVDQVTCQYLLKQAGDSLSGNRVNHHFYEALLRNHFLYQAREKWQDISQKGNAKEMTFDQLEAAISRYTHDHIQLASWLLPRAFREKKRTRARQLVANVVRTESIGKIFLLPASLHSQLSFQGIFYLWWDIHFYLLIRVGKYIKRKLHISNESKSA